MIVYSAAHDSTCHWQVDGGMTNSMAGMILYGETWNSSGTLNALQPTFYMRNGIIPSLRTMPIEFDLQFRNAFQPASMFGIMAPNTDPDRDVQLGYAMGPSEWDDGPDPYPMAIWDEDTYQLPAMDKGPTVITIIPPFPWLSTVSPFGAKCTVTYHRDSFLPTPGTIPPGPAGMGGGAVRLVVNRELQLNGSIRANGIAGETGSYPGGGGSGGSISIQVGALSGNGNIQANGGNAGGSKAGGGASGRPALTPVFTTSGAVVISWPAVASGWVVECIADTTPDGQWTEIPPELYQSGSGTISYTEPIADRKFFRLRKATP